MCDVCEGVQIVFSLFQVVQLDVDVQCLYQGDVVCYWMIQCDGFGFDVVCLVLCLVGMILQLQCFGQCQFGVVVMIEFVMKCVVVM